MSGCWQYKLYPPQIQIFIWFTVTSNQVWWDCGDIYGNILNRSQFWNSTGVLGIFHLSFQSSLPGRLAGILISPWQVSVYRQKAEALRIKSDLQMIDERASSQCIIHLVCQLTPVTTEKCQRVSRSQRSLPPPTAVLLFFYLFFVFFPCWCNIEIH